MKVIKVVEKKISELKEYKNNPRVNKEAIEPVAESIKLFGFKQPIVIDKNNVIVCGHTRYKAAIKLGLKSVPCVVASDLTDDEISAYRIADNKTAEFADWDFSKLEIELAAIDLDMSVFGEFDFSDTLDSHVDIKELNYSEKYGVVIDCVDESEQQKVFDFVRSAGYAPRLVSI